MKLIDKSALVAEFNRLIAELIEEGEGTMFERGRISAFEDAKLFLDTLEVKEVDLDAYTKVSKALSVAFMQFLDNIKPEEKMCLSNAECFDIEKAFAMMNYSKLLRYMEKYSRFKAQKGEEI